MSNYPLVKFHFSVHWGDGKIGFSEVSGLDMETEIIEYRDGADPNYMPKKIPGLQKSSIIKFKRGMLLGDIDFFQWYRAVRQGERRDITISLLNEQHEPVVVWRVKNAWPNKIQSTNLKADASEVAIESMEVVHEGIIMQEL